MLTDAVSRRPHSRDPGPTQRLLQQSGSFQFEKSHIFSGCVYLKKLTPKNFARTPQRSKWIFVQEHFSPAETDSRTTFVCVLSIMKKKKFEKEFYG
jgi:hypothetical protein